MVRRALLEGRNFRKILERGWVDSGGERNMDSGKESVCESGEKWRGWRKVWQAITLVICMHKIDRREIRDGKRRCEEENC